MKVRPFLKLIAYLNDLLNESGKPNNSKSYHDDCADVEINYQKLKNNLETLEKELKSKKVEIIRDFYDHDLKQKQEDLIKHAYLKNVTQSYIFDDFKKEVFLHDSEKNFYDGTTQEERDMYIRLKFKALNEARKKD